MKNNTKIFLIFIFLLISLEPVYSQFVAKQKFIDFSFAGSYSNKYEGDRFYNRSDGTFSGENYRKVFRFTNVITLERLHSDRYATGYNFFLNFTSNKDAQIAIDSLYVVYEKENSDFKYFGFGAGKMLKWIYPIGKKFGCNLSINTNLLFGFGNSNSVSDSANGYNVIWSKYTSRYGTINANMNLGLYYWVSPKIVLNTKIAIANAYISMSSQKRNGTNMDDSQIYYNTAFYSLFSSERSLVTQSIGISFLLK